MDLNYTQKYVEHFIHYKYFLLTYLCILTHSWTSYIKILPDEYSDFLPNLNRHTY